MDAKATFQRLHRTGSGTHLSSSFSGSVILQDRAVHNSLTWRLSSTCKHGHNTTLIEHLRLHTSTNCCAKLGATGECSTKRTTTRFANRNTMNRLQHAPRQCSPQNASRRRPYAILRQPQTLRRRQSAIRKGSERTHLCRASSELPYVGSPPSTLLLCVRSSIRERSVGMCTSCQALSLSCLPSELLAHWQRTLGARTDCETGVEQYVILED